jgi:hypothetical protein
MVTFIGYGAACPDYTVGHPHPVKSPRGVRQRRNLTGSDTEATIWGHSWNKLLAEHGDIFFCFMPLNEGPCWAPIIGIYPNLTMLL